MLAKVDHPSEPVEVLKYYLAVLCQACQRSDPQISLGASSCVVRDKKLLSCW
jgi:hypothetical protein